jgi:hypothetical protein
MYSSFSSIGDIVNDKVEVALYSRPFVENPDPIDIIGKLDRPVEVYVAVEYVSGHKARLGFENRAIRPLKLLNRVYFHSWAMSMTRPKKRQTVSAGLPGRSHVLEKSVFIETSFACKLSPMNDGFFYSLKVGESVP